MVHDGTGFAGLIALDACPCRSKLFNLGAWLHAQLIETICERRDHDGRIQKTEIAEGSAFAFGS